MSDEKDDLELEALQRRLDDAFATTRPRRDFEDELWMRMQARRPASARLRDAFAALVAGFREAPAVPIGAVAVLLIVVVGIGVIANGGLNSNHNTYSGSSAQLAPADLAVGEFGRLPTPRLDPNAPDKNAPSLALSAGPAAPIPAPTTANLYFGPANLRWTGQMPVAAVQAPVYRYSEPTAADADQYAASLGAAKDAQAKPEEGFLGRYVGNGFVVLVRQSAPQLPLEPTFVFMITTTSPNNEGADSRSVAESFLARYSLAPQWPNTVTVQHVGSQTVVQYQRAFSLPTGGLAYLVNWSGERYGLSVEIGSGTVGGCTGPLPLNLDTANYRLIANDQAVQQALTRPAASSQRISPVPTVNLTDVQLVYALAISRGQGFYEPAYLFSGTFQYNGQTYTKRVLVPLVDPSQRS